MKRDDDDGLRLFDECERFDDDGAPFNASRFEYLNGSNRPAAARVRALLESSFEHYKHPRKDRADVRARFRKSEAREHLGALAELVWHEILLRLDCRLEPHPTLPGTSNHPDYLVRQPVGRPFYLESVVDMLQSREAAGKERIRADLHARLDSEVRHPDFYVEAALRGSLPGQPSIKRVAAKVAAWLDSLEYDEVVEAYERRSGVPAKDFPGDGFVLHCTPLPKGRNRGQLDRGLGIVSHPMMRDTSVESAREVLRKKATKYGRLDLPYVVALNVMTVHRQRLDLLDILFGVPAMRFSQNPDGSTTKEVVRTDGLWKGPGEGKGNGVSAVLAVTYMDGWTLGTMPAWLAHNPWPRHLYEGVLNRVPRLHLGRDPLPGDSIAMLLGLPADWPGEE